MCNYLQKSFLFFLFLCALPEVYAMENNDQQQTEEEKKLISYLSKLDTTTLSKLADHYIEQNKSIKNENVVKGNSYMLAQIINEFLRRSNEIMRISNYNTVMKLPDQKMDMLLPGVDRSPRRISPKIIQLPPQDNDQINQILAVIQSQNNTNNNPNLLLGYKQPKPKDKDSEKKTNEN